MSLPFLLFVESTQEALHLCHVDLHAESALLAEVAQGLAFRRMRAARGEDFAEHVRTQAEAMLSGRQVLRRSAP